MVISDGKSVVTRCNGTLATILAMRNPERDDSWKLCVGTWDRLQWARSRVFETAQDAAEAFGERPGTYRAYERGPDASKSIPLDHQKAIAFAKRLGVRWEWLLEGKGEPWRATDEYLDRILAAYEAVDPERRGEMADVVERLLRTAAANRR